jgi:hypothetical protein
MKERMWPLPLLVVCGLAGAILAGCSTNSPEIPKDEFTKPHPIPPAARQGMQDAMKRATAPPTGH